MKDSPVDLPVNAKSPVSQFPEHRATRLAGSYAVRGDHDVIETIAEAVES